MPRYSTRSQQQGGGSYNPPIPITDVSNLQTALDGKSSKTGLDSIIIYADWFLDGTIPPDPYEVLESTGKVIIRNFSGSDDNDVVINWVAPFDLTASSTITYRVSGFISQSTAPANGETVKFSLKGCALADNDILSKSLGTAVTVTKTFDGSHVQYDRWTTDWSDAVTITDLAALRYVKMVLTRDTTDTYAQKIGITEIEIRISRTQVAA